MKILFSAVFSLICGICFAQKSGQFLAWDTQKQCFVPEGYVLGIQDIATQTAIIIAASNRAEAVSEATASAKSTVDSVTSMLLGAEGFGYISGYVVSFGNSVSIDTNNVKCSIIDFDFGGAGNTNIEGTAYSGHNVRYVYTSQIDSVPYLRYKVNLLETNDWEIAEFQNTSHYADSVTINGIVYTEVYQSTVWIPSIYDTSFFRVFTEVSSGGSSDIFTVANEFKVGTESGFTGWMKNWITSDTYEMRYYKCGVLTTKVMTQAEWEAQQ